MKKYITPEIENVVFSVSDVITSSAGIGEVFDFTSGEKVNIEDYFG